jgi:hypothetical protein
MDQLKRLGCSHVGGWEGLVGHFPLCATRADMFVRNFNLREILDVSEGPTHHFT